jgi:uncharacterized protein
MRHASRVTALATMLVCGVWAPSSAQAPAAADLVTQGIRQVEDGDLEGAIATLTTAVRRLSMEAPAAAELARAHLHLGVAYALLDQEKAARASFREALQHDPGLRLDPARFPPKVQKLLEEARPQTTPATPTPTAAAAPSPLASPLGPHPLIAYLGTSVERVTEEVRQARGLPDLSGALVKIIEGPAAAAGIQVGDVIRKIDGVNVTDYVDFADVQIRRWRPGDRVTLSVWRDRHLVEIQAVLGDKLEFLVPRCDQGEATACEALGMEYVSGRSLAKDVAHAASLFRRACDADPAGCYSLAWLHVAKQVTPDPPEAARLLQRSCDGGTPGACLLLGWAQDTGYGVRKDKGQASASFKRACELGLQEACDARNARSLAERIIR